MKPKKPTDIIRETLLTYDDYAALPDDGKRYELADGVLELMSPAPTPRHQAVSFEIHKALSRSCESDYWIFSSPVDVILSDTEVRQPDLVMVHRSRTSIVTRRGIDGAPDLVVEILSPHSRKRDKVDKLRSYAKHGVPEYWIVDMASCSLEQYVLDDGSYVIHDVYAEDEPVQSERLSCVSFTMNELLATIRDLPD